MKYPEDQIRYEILHRLESKTDTQQQIKDKLWKLGWSRSYSFWKDHGITNVSADFIWSLSMAALPEGTMGNISRVRWTFTIAEEDVLKKLIKFEKLEKFK